MSQDDDAEAQSKALVQTRDQARIPAPTRPEGGARSRLRSWLGGAVRGVGLAVGAVAVWIGALPVIAAVDLERRLPAAEALLDGRERGSIAVLDSDGVRLGQRGQRFDPLTVDDAAPILIDAVLAIEDRRYYWHVGVDPIGVIRALAANWRAGRTVQGGSSIPQQVAKLAFLSRARTVERKLRELPLAMAMERAYSKDELLSIYLNRVYLGAGAYGFEAASRRYFQTSARRLTTAQAALLAGLLRAPSRWSPKSDFAAARRRAEIVLAAMLDSGRIDALERERALAELASMWPPATVEVAPHFVDWIVAQTEALMDQGALFGPSSNAEAARMDDVVVATTLDTEAQSAAYNAMEAAFAAYGAPMDGVEAAITVLGVDGAVRAMVGGRDYSRSQFNRAADAERQLGSAFKPFVYAAALEAGVRPNDYVDDAPVRIGDWRPRNYNDAYRGEITLEEALAHSSNAAAVRMLQAAGAERVVDVARRAGFSREIEPYPSLALGAIESNPLEVASAYRVFAREGKVGPSHAIVEIRTTDGRLLWTPTPTRDDRALSRERSGWVTTMMREVVWSGTGRRASLGETRAAAGKTGTTQSHRDAWFAGFTGQYVGVVWIGRDDNAPLDGVVGGEIPAEIWRETMRPLHNGLAELSLPERTIPAAGPRPIEPAARPSVATADSRRSGGGLFNLLFGGGSGGQNRESSVARSRDVIIRDNER